MYIRPERHKFYNSKQWKAVRKAYFTSQNGLCERCKAKALEEGTIPYVKGNIVHHKIELNDMNVNDTKIIFDFSNLELLCYDCHNKEHKARSNTNNSSGKGATSKDSYFTAKGGFVIKDGDEEE